MNVVYLLIVHDNRDIFSYRQAATDNYDAWRTIATNLGVGEARFHGVTMCKPLVRRGYTADVLQQTDVAHLEAMWKRLLTSEIHDTPRYAAIKKAAEDKAAADKAKLDAAAASSEQAGAGRKTKQVTTLGEKAALALGGGACITGAVGTGVAFFSGAAALAAMAPVAGGALVGSCILKGYYWYTTPSAAKEKTE